MKPKIAPTPQPSPWLGVLGVVVVIGFAGLAVFDTSFSPRPASANAAASASVVAPDAAESLDSAEQPIPLYASEAGAHTPTEAKPASPPGPEATSLFDSH